jgi:hypothetical protein
MKKSFANMLEKREKTPHDEGPFNVLVLTPALRL